MQKIQVEILINAGVDKVWKDYTDPKCVTGWAFASDDWECPYAEAEVKAGGRFLTRMQAKDKSFGFDFTGTYTVVEEGKRLVYKMDKTDTELVARECEVTFESVGANLTNVIVVFDSEDENPIEMQKGGWQSILNNFKKFVERT
jgi:uncharacterized protein YndB with AHSA1/START domain